MEQKITARDYKVLTEKISPDNVAEMAELIALYNNSAGISSAKTNPDIPFQTVTTSSKAWRYSYATTLGNIWTTYCISPKEASRERYRRSVISSSPKWCQDFENNYFFSPSISKRKTVGSQTYYVRRYFNGGKDFEQTMKSIAVQRTIKK